MELTEPWTACSIMLSAACLTCYRCRESEVRQVSDLQAEIFTLGFGVPPIDSLLLTAFKVTLLSGLLCCSSCLPQRLTLDMLAGRDAWHTAPEAAHADQRGLLLPGRGKSRQCRAAAGLRGGVTAERAGACVALASSSRACCSERSLSASALDCDCPIQQAEK